MRYKVLRDFIFFAFANNSSNLLNNNVRYIVPFLSRTKYYIIVELSALMLIYTRELTAIFTRFASGHVLG